MKKKSVGQFVANWSMVILLLVLVVFFGIMSDVFLTPTNITNILVQNVHVAVCTTAVFIIMVSGGCDLSIGYQVSVAAVLCTKLLAEGVVNVPVAILIAIATCALLGAFNGFMTLKLKSNAMIVTLGTMAIFQGVSYLISGSKTFHNLPKSLLYLGQGKIAGVVPVNVVIMLVVVLVAIFVLVKTSIGRSVYAAGDNPEAARLAGLNVGKVKLLSFTVAGALVGISAILLAARSGSADSSTGVGIEFTGITACVLSGVALKGGEGTLWKAIIAVYVLGILANGMQLINLGTYPQYIAKGVIMLFSLYLSSKEAKTA
ncbi:MAG: ABC transporter permease [bacterium]|nr:ABC transporter permease [bacterium]MDY4099421.1 ABC transporter permease [Lachnospiraceae bacterium]